MAGETKAAPPARSTADLCAAAEIGPEARQLLDPQQPPSAYLDQLIAREKFEDAVRFLAHALPKREAVWWAWFCASRAGSEPSPQIQASLAATEKWIAQPTDENRRAAMTAAGRATVGTPAGCAGLAAFLSGGSLAPPDLPPNPPAEFVSAKAVAGAVMLAAVAAEPEKAPEKYRAFLSQGVKVTRKIRLWDQSE